MEDGEDLTIQDLLLTNSRISPRGNGSEDGNPVCFQPSSGQKWWTAIILGFIFALISSPPAYHLTSYISTSLGGMALANGGPNLAGLAVHTIIFILIIRIILW